MQFDSTSEKIISTAKRIAGNLQNTSYDVGENGWVFFTSTITYIEGEDHPEDYRRDWQWTRNEHVKYILRKDGRVFIHKSRDTIDDKYLSSKKEQADLGTTELNISNLDSDHTVREAVEYLDFDAPSNWSFSKEGHHLHGRYSFNHPKDYLWNIPGLEYKIADGSIPYGLLKYYDKTTRAVRPVKPFGQGILEMLEALPAEVKKKEQAIREKEQAIREEEQRKLAQQQSWECQGLCRYCGNKLTLFTRRCKSCYNKN